MKALVTGAGGQVARALIAAAPPGWTIAPMTRADLDVTDRAAVETTVATVAPDLIINAGAYTAVDRAESESEAAFAVNRDGPAHLAAAARAAGSRLVHFSTDFVFDGRSGRPYRPDDEPAPASVYGASKLAGETAVLETCPEALIVRTAWVYGPIGGNFLTTMLRLMAERPELEVVADQIGTPTSTLTLAPAVWGFAAAGARGIWHFTDAGAASWYDFAQAIAEEALAAGLLGTAPPIRPIATIDYPTAAARPAYSVLDKSAAFALLGGPAPHWRVALRQVLREMKASRG
ncbi:MAG TPA: dTDP-4-dehydrorhamnose reductase [Caulobacteraceae bacterium]|nr:dTDP-4-dehydrorhamnose reductase [Caulobacteraceae bacterium]